MITGRILFSTDDAREAKRHVKACQSAGLRVTITTGVEHLFAVREVIEEPAHALTWDRAYLKFRRELLTGIKNPIR